MLSLGEELLMISYLCRNVLKYSIINFIMSMILSTMKHEYLNQMNREGSTKESSFEEVVVICKRLFDWWNSTTVENSIDFS